MLRPADRDRSSSRTSRNAHQRHRGSSSPPTRDVLLCHRGRPPDYGRGIRAVVNAIAIRPGAVAIGAKDAIGAALVRNAQLEGKNITVTTDAEGVVTLGGIVRSWAERRQAEHAAFAAPGVTGVANHLRIEQ